MSRPRLVQVAMGALARMRESLELEPLPVDELERQATVFLHSLYAQGWILRALPPAEDEREARPL